jgi:hypothetical protein
MVSFYTGEGWRGKEEEVREDAGDELKEKKTTAREEKIGKKIGRRDYVIAVESEEDNNQCRSVLHCIWHEDKLELRKRQLD